MIDGLRGAAASSATAQLVRYVIVAGCGYVFAVAAYVAALAIGIPAYPAVVLTFVLNGLFNFVVMRIWTFPESGRGFGSDFRRFATVAIGSLAINYTSFALLYSGLGIRAAIAQAIAIIIAAPFGFLANRLWSFSS